MTGRRTHLCALALLPAVGSAQVPDNCEPLRTQIEANIAAKGVTGFTVGTVDAAAVVPGQVVGSCGNGSKKIVYARGSVSAAHPVTPVTPAPAAVPRVQAPKNATRDEDILTECKDGTVSMGGSCKN